jgi:hypothetical protein
MLNKGVKEFSRNHKQAWEETPLVKHDPFV